MVARSISRVFNPKILLGEVPALKALHLSRQARARAGGCWCSHRPQDTPLAIHKPPGLSRSQTAPANVRGSVPHGQWLQAMEATLVEEKPGRLKLIRNFLYFSLATILTRCSFPPVAHAVIFRSASSAKRF
jgi:hypothetical protein